MPELDKLTQVAVTVDIAQGNRGIVDATGQADPTGPYAVFRERTAFALTVQDDGVAAVLDATMTYRLIGKGTTSTALLTGDPLYTVASKLWNTATAYAQWDVVFHGAQGYVCTAAHTSGDDDEEPGTGANWANYWETTDAHDPANGLLLLVANLNTAELLAYLSAGSLGTIGPNDQPGKRTRCELVSIESGTERRTLAQGNLRIGVDVISGTEGDPLYAIDRQHNVDATAAPTVDDDEDAGYGVGSVWIDNSADPVDIYICRDASAGAADWDTLITEVEFQAHTTDTSNPHSVTYAQAGADIAGAADTAVAGHESTHDHTQLHAHANQEQLDLVTDGDHDARTDNPHTVTAAQAGADPVGTAAAAVSAHEGAADPHTGYLQKADNLADLNDASAARSNLGLGTAAEVDVPAAGNAAAGEAVLGSDTRLTDSRTPVSHASSHQSGGSDAIQLDELAAPNDNTNLDATTGAHGLLPKLGGGSTNFLRADGTWAAPPGAGGGEANTASNVGGQSEVFKAKVDVDLRFRTLKAGTNVNVTQQADTIEIAATSGEILPTGTAFPAAPSTGQGFYRTDLAKPAWYNGAMWLFADGSAAPRGALTPSFWWAADGEGEADTDPVERMSDLSGNGLHLTQATSSKRADMVASAVNGHKAIEFDGVDDFYQGASAADWKFLHDGTDWTVFLVMKVVPANPDATYGLLATNGSGSSSQIGTTVSYRDNSADPRNESLQFSIYRGVSATYVINGCKTADGDAPTQTWLIGECVFENGAAGDDGSVLVDGTVEGTLEQGNSPNGSNPQQALVCGAYADGTIHANIQLAEIYIISSADATERAAIRDGLADTYNITVA